MNNKDKDSKIEFNELIKDSNKINEHDITLAWHVAFHNKTMIWCKILHSAYLTIRLYTILILSGYYFYKKIIEDDKFSKIMQFAFDSPNSYINLLIICVTAICYYLIKNKYK